jgi:hypothetical protein
MNMANEDKVIDKLKDITGKIDHKALAGAVGLMCLSWAALPVVYWLIVRKKNDEKANKKESRQ